jgi:hypothetical protein
VRCSQCPTFLQPHNQIIEALQQLWREKLLKSLY